MLYATSRNRSRRRRVTPPRPGFAFALSEKWDRSMVSDILSRKSSMMKADGEFDLKLQKQLLHIDSQPAGNIQMPYYSPEATLPFGIQGRVFGSGLQNTPGWVRRLCSHKFYHDIDIVNCFPEILLQIKQKKGVTIDTPKLEQYVADREVILAQDMQQVPGLTRKEAKEQYLKTMFGSDQPTYETPFLTGYKDEINYIIDYLWRLAEYRTIRQYVESDRGNRPNGSNVRGRFLSNVITTVERQIIDTAMQRVREPDMLYNANVYVFDGFMVQKKPGVDQFPPEHLAELSRAVNSATGYHVKFVEKSLTPTIADIEHIRPSFNNMISRSKWDARGVFKEIGKLAIEFNMEPKPENVSAFQKAIIPVMNLAFARLKGIIALVVVRDVGTMGPNDITYQRSKIDDARKNWSTEKFFIDDGEKKHVIIPIDEWLKSSLALSYDDICFNPRPYNNPRCASPFHINTYVGIAYPQTEKLTAQQCQQLEQNELKPFWEHIRRIWCKEDEELFQYVKHWIWSKTTRPEFRVECALILQSEQGAGKGIIVEKVAEVIGLQYMSKPSSLDQITGNTFNKHYFERCLIMFLDEAFYAGSKSTKNQVKTIITDRYVSLNEKFMPQYIVENFLSMVLASNEDHVVNREVKARRYLNMSLSNEHSGNHGDQSMGRSYFNAISDVDPQTLSNYLHSIEAPENWTGRNIPTNIEGEEQAILSFSKWEEFLHAIMVDPTCIQHCRLEYLQMAPVLRDDFSMEEGHDLLKGSYLKSAIYDHFTKNVARGFTWSQRFVTTQIKKYIPTDPLPERVHVRGKQEYLLNFPNLEEAREGYKLRTGLTHTQF